MNGAGSSARVAVIGGGVLGVSTAAHLARRGTDVVLVTEGSLASGASGRSLSWLNSFGAGRSAAYHRLRLLGIDRFHSFAAQLPTAADYLKFDGGLTWASPDKVDAHRAAFAQMRVNGYQAEWLSHRDVAVRVPGVDPSAIPDEGAILNAGEGWVDLRLLICELAEELTRSGGRVLTGTGAATPVVEGDRVVAVLTGDGQRIDVDAAVLATGADVPVMVGKLGVDLPEATPLALLVRTQPVDVPLRAVLNTPLVALRPTPDGALVMDSGATSREVRVRPDGSFEVPDATVETLLSRASAVLVGNPKLRLHSYGVGRKPIPGDGEPVLGELGQVSGLHIAFTHSGATLALIVGELLAEQIVSGRPSPLLDDFRPTRFRTDIAEAGG